MPKKSPSIRPDRPDQELREIALGIQGGRVITSAQVPQDIWHVVFFPLAFMGAKAIRELHKKGERLAMGRIEHAIPTRYINGFPMFTRCSMLNLGEWTKIKGFIQELDGWEGGKVTTTIFKLKCVSCNRVETRPAQDCKGDDPPACSKCLSPMILLQVVIEQKGGGAEHQRAIDRPLTSRPSGRTQRASNKRTRKRDG